MVALIFVLAIADVQRPSQLPAGVLAGCDIVHAIVFKVPGTKTRRQTGTFDDETFRAPIAGCRIDIDGSFARARITGAAPERLRQGLEARGWLELPDFSSDGPDGTSFAYSEAGVTCFARGEWDGGADDDPKTPPLDPYKLTVICGSAKDFAR